MPLERLTKPTDPNKLPRMPKAVRTRYRQLATSFNPNAREAWMALASAYDMTDDQIAKALSLLPARSPVMDAYLAYRGIAK